MSDASGAVRTIGHDVIEAIVVEALESAPPDATHWSTRSLAAKHGISRQTVSEIWRAFGLKPWRTDSFKVSPDPELVEKIRDLVGLYIDPPVAAVVFALDEKPQIQALDRTAPTLPMLPTTPERATHDYERNGTCDLFAALNVATGTVKGRVTCAKGVVREVEVHAGRAEALDTDFDCVILRAVFGV